MITSINEFKYSLIVNEQNTDVAAAVWQFYSPGGRKKFLGIEGDGKVNNELVNKAWPELAPALQQKVKDWIINNPWEYTNLTAKSSWQEYINRNI